VNKKFSQQEVQCFSWSPFVVRLNPAGDGNCQFASLSDQLLYRTGLQIDANCIRRDVVSYLREHPTTCDGTLLTEFETGPHDWEKHMNIMGCDGTYGDNKTLLAASQLFGVQIVVISSLGAQGTRVVARDSVFDAAVPSLFLGHLAEGHGEHYISLTVPDNLDISKFLSSCRSKGNKVIFLCFLRILIDKN
jgi:hypothetical protein